MYYAMMMGKVEENINFVRKKNLLILSTVQTGFNFLWLLDIMYGTDIAIYVYIVEWNRLETREPTLTGMANQ
jgi:hypothetical protein